MWVITLIMGLVVGWFAHDFWTWLIGRAEDDLK